MVHEPISLMLVNARKSSGLTQAQVAERIGTKQSAIARYEKGLSSPSIDTLQRLMRANGFELIIDFKKSSRIQPRSKLAKRVQRHRGTIRKIIHEAGGQNIRVIGSVARGTDTAKSDLDLLVDVDKESGKTLDVFFANRKISKLVGVKVDIAVSRLLKKEVLKSALRDAIPL